MIKTSGVSRIEARPDPAAWADDELMTLREAAALLWPAGPLTETSLRTAARDRRLPISRIAGKFFVTKNALKALSVCVPLEDVPITIESRRPTDGAHLKDLLRVSNMGRRR